MALLANCLASNDEYLAGIGHRTAALEDSRLLPIDERGGRCAGLVPWSTDAVGGRCDNPIR